MNDKQLDQDFQKKVEHVQKHNGIHVFWNKEGVWKKIQKALEDSPNGPKMIAWYTVMAASVSLLVASTVNFVNYDYELFNAEDAKEIVKVESSDFKKSPTASTVYYSALPADSMIIPVRSRQVQSLATAYVEHTIDRLPVADEKLRSVTRMSTESLQQSKFNQNVKFHISGGIGANTRFIAPKIDLGLKINLTRSSNVRKSLFLGSSIQLMRSINSEQGSNSRFSKGYFLKSAYENERYENGKLKSWSTGAELLIHSNDDSLPGNSLRVFYNRSIYGRLRIGPEVLFTKDFKRVYPGITLALG